MQRIGLTGGIGTGKTTVSNLFKSLGVPVIDADEISHKITRPGQPATLEIQRQWGDEVVSEDGALNRSKLREKVFSDPRQLAKLESILHPAIKQEISRQAADLEATQTVYCLIVIPLIFEKEFTDLVDKIIAVDLPIETQIERVMERDNVSKIHVERILQQQLSRDERLQRSDYIIENTGSRENLFKQIDALHKKFSEYHH